MLTIDDCNTLLKKYKDAGFWYEIDFSKLNLTHGVTVQYDFCRLTFSTNYHGTLVCHMAIDNSLWNGFHYFTGSEGLIWKQLSPTTSLEYPYYFTGVFSTLKLRLYLTPSPIGEFNLTSQISYGLFLPISSLQIPVMSGGYDDKFYIDPVGDSIKNYLIDGEISELEEDENGKFLRLESANDCILGSVTNTDPEYTFSLYRVTFREFKTIPNLVIDILYKGTSQEVKLYNYDTEEHITEFQAYYQGRKLKDNIITLDYDVDDTVDIVVDILDPAYPQSRVKLKASTIYYVARTQAELETAITNGIKTVMVTNHQQPMTRAVNEYVLLTSMELTDLNLINSDIHLTDCTVDNVNIISTTFKDKGDNKFTDCKFQETTITSTGNPSKYNDCIITECTVTATELRLTGAITNTTLYNSLIISDGLIEVIGNTFTGKYSKDYFPSFLYLTGDYLAKNNTFTLSDTWTEPAFNMCIIKSIDSFNPSLFIAENTFSLNIEYSTEEPNTFYYNIVDDDKIKAKRLS